MWLEESGRSGSRQGVGLMGGLKIGRLGTVRARGQRRAQLKKRTDQGRWVFIRKYG